MNKNGEKTKLLAVIAVFAMVACALVAFAPSAVAADTTYTHVGDTNLDSTDKDVTVIGSDGKEITTLTFKQALYVLSYTSATGQQYFTDVTLPENITVDALTGEGQTFQFAAGLYDVVGTSGNWSVSKFVVNADNVTITAADGAKVTFAGGLLNGANQSPETDLNQGDTIAIMGDNVTIQNVTVMPIFQTTDNSTYFANKAIQVFGDNTVISGVVVTANTLTAQTDSYGGSIYVGSGNSSDITEVTVKDTTVENGIVTFSGLAASNSTDVTLDSVEISVSDYSEGYYAINNSQKIGGNVSASEVAVSIEDTGADLGGILQYAVPGTTVNVDAVMTLSASATVKAGVTLAVGENGSIAASNSATLTVYGALEAAADDVTASVIAGSNAEISEGITTTAVDTSDIQTFDALKNAVEGGEEKITITKPIDMTDNLVISGNTEITMSKDGALIGLNGYTITSNGQGSIKEFKVAEGTNNDRGDFAILTLNGSFEISPGSIIVNGQLVDENEILVRNGGTYVVSGSLNGDLTITYDAGNSSGATVLFDDFSLNNSGRLMLDDNITYEVDSEDATKASYFYLYGTIVPYVSEGNDNKGVTISVDSENTFRAYAGAQLSSDVLVQPVNEVTDAVIDLSQAQSTLTISQDVMTSVSYGQLQSIVIDGVLSIRNNSTLEIQGDLVISEGTILTIESGSKLVVNGNVATVSVDGTIDILDGGMFSVEVADDVSVAGVVNSYGTVDIQSKVTIENGGIIRINEDDYSSIEVTGGLTIENGGELAVSSKMDINDIANNGTVTLSGAVLTGNSTISLTAAGAIVNIVSVTGADDGTNTANTYKLTIDDLGLKFADNGKKTGNSTITHEVGKEFNGVVVKNNGIEITLNENCGVSGLTVTEAVSGNGSEKTPYVNEMYFAGTVGFIDNTGNSDGDFGGMKVTGDRLYVSETLTLGADVILNVDGAMTISGTVYAIAGSSANDNLSDVTIGTNGKITVTGLMQLADDLEPAENGRINAAYYTTTSEGATYHNYTNFVDAVAANPATVYIYGEVTVLEDVTIPSPMVIRNEGTLIIGSTENRDVTVTVANGASFRSGTVKVLGTMYFENKRNDNIATPESDVRIEGDVDRTYTNIYTALNDAEAGETVTITRDGIVWLDADLTIKTGVILDVPNTRYIGLENGVTLTVDGTLRTAHPVELRENGNFAVEASNSSVDGYASAIVVNGTFMSMAEMPYADDEVAGQQGYMIPGAYYTVIDSNGVYNYITPVEAAAAVSANAVDGAFVINGKVTSGDVTFTGTDAQPVTVTVSDGSEYTASSITLVGATLETVDDGLFNGTVTVGDASIEAYKVQLSVDSENGLTLQAVVNEKDEKEVTKTISTLNIATGTVILADVTGTYSVSGDGKIIVDAGATLTVPTRGSGSVDGDLTVNGTVAVGNAQRLTVTGDLFVNGTATVAAASDAGAAGTLYVGTNTDNERKGTMYVGLDAKFATTGATATVTGIVNVPTIYAVAGATVDAEIIEDMDTTAYYVEGTVWINAYGDGDLVVPNMKNAPVENAYFNNVWQNADETEKYDVDSANGIGTPEAVYAIVEYDVYVINLRADQNAVSSITIDGNVMQFGMIISGTSFDDVGFYYGYTATVAAGSHTIQYQLANGYSGEGVLTVNGTQQSGLTFTTEGNPTEAQGGKITYNLQLTGFEKSGYVPDSPDTGDSGESDSGMTITDYLLIVLVVLIIVMAIIVAMRLMRS